MRPTTKLRIRAAGAQDAASEDTAVDKAQIRRVQVRKAQARHRQRKANYVKQLEMDVARLREMIETAERDSQLLLNENRAIRAQIEAAVRSKSLPLSLDQRVSLLKDTPPPSQLSSDTRVSLQPDLDAVTVTLGFDEMLNAARFYISSPPPTSHPPSRQESPPGPDTADLPDLTPSETQAAINFILA
ncbi:uncharacterized protein THITE_2121733 [Thermothielavioides terrestris NRRL 8126]|uniref:BZIP domain-containing protein n=1 Tax=Thermothielavioides terrestris (strain ATCC 38088 / NRRL 8126) TaxID=578455 RepID=G2RF88_THETT|nr:uncharacterized protein THITE_2121733 [Thermothielavioides terrestris NRRL 8126]AEO70371.1 hypothetical protein THITE_2121733 [Thermothielavioides terrestris NRRL 8126]